MSVLNLSEREKRKFAPQIELAQASYQDVSLEESRNGEDGCFKLLH